MKFFKVIVLGLSMVVFFNCKEVKKDTDTVTEEMEEAVNDVMDEPADKTLKVMLEPKSESTVKGEVTFVEENGKVSLMATLTGLTPGEHAIHLHEKADCSAADGTSTGGHWNPTFSPHGKWGAAEGYHKGDIGNFTADAAGNGEVAFETEEWCIGCGDDTKDILGKGVIVHQGADDFATQPTGDAGSRVSCAGVIQ